MAKDLTKIKFTPEELRECYIDKNMTQREMARHFHVDVRKIRAAMQKECIETRKKNRGKSTSFTEQEFCDCYTDKSISVDTITERFHISRRMVYYLAKKYKLVPTKQKGSLKEIYIAYMHGAAERNYVFELTIEQFQEITQQNCFYCGQPPSLRRRKRIYNGIDRIDNTQGYTITNSRPCCKQCNYAKGKLSEQEFLDWLQKAASHMAKGR